MATYALPQLLPANVFVPMLILCRAGAAIGFMPGIGDTYVPVRVRLVLAVAMAFVLSPVLADRLPPMPENPMMLAALISAELMIGAFLGLFARTLLASLETAGGVIAQQASLSSAIVFNPGALQGQTLPAGLLGALGLVLLFSTDLHHLILSAVVDSYMAFPAGAMPPMGDLTDAMVRLVSRGFTIGMQISAPYLILGTIFYVVLGLLGRVMPQIQIFYVALPLQILGGIAMLAVTIPASILWFMGMFDAVFSSFTRPV